MAYKAIDVAKYIINKCSLDDCPVSNLQLQKILFFLQKEYLKVRDEKFFDDAIQAWQFGPVVPSVYYKYCGFGSMDIFLKYDDLIVDSSCFEKMDEIIIQKRKLDPWILVDETHKLGGAWEQVYKNGLGNHMEIPPELIKEKG